MQFRIVVEIIALYILPVVFFIAGVVPIGWRLAVFQVFIGLLGVIAWRRRVSWRALGVRTDTFRRAIFLLLPGVVVALVLIVVLYRSGYGTSYFFNAWWINVFFLYYLVIGAPSQELAYRGYLHERLQILSTRPWVLVVLNALLFSLLHALHQSVLITAGTFLLGVYLTAVWIRQPNLWASSLAHGVVGATAIVLGYF